jgi:hypothetical protein
MKLVVPAVIILSALLTQPSHGQQFPETRRQKDEDTREKAQAARKKADREATDEALQSHDGATAEDE